MYNICMSLIRKMEEPAICKVREYHLAHDTKSAYSDSNLAKNRRPSATKSPANLSPLTVALTGDWHISPMVFDRQAHFLRSRLVKIRPDVIILQGDILDTPDSLLDQTMVKKLKAELKICSSLAPTVMVLGNHDLYRPVHKHFSSLEAFKSALVLEGAADKWAEICTETNVKLLCNEWFEYQNLRIFGFYQTPEMYYRPDGKGENFAKMRQKLTELKQSDLLIPQPDKINWFAAHAPLQDLANSSLLKGFDVFSFGHMHGGATPLLLDDLFDAFNYHGGLYAPFGHWFPTTQARGCTILRSSAKLIVNSGMVLSQYSAPKILHPINFLKAAEITKVVV